jgi:hypothetical protein
MKERRIDITSYFGYDPDFLRATQPDNWFVENSEPRPGTDYKPAAAIEELMDRFTQDGLGKTQPGG